MFCHLQGLSTITSSCWQCNLRLMLPMLCLQWCTMHNVPSITAQLFYVRLMENGPVTSSASLANSGMFYVQLILRMKTALRLSVCYWRHANSWFLSTAMMKSRERQQKNCGRRLQSLWDSVEKDPRIEHFIATALGSSHVPSHLLCKDHTVHTLDISNINVLAHLESSL